MINENINTWPGEHTRPRTARVQRICRVGTHVLRARARERAFVGERKHETLRSIHLLLLVVQRRSRARLPIMR